MQKFDPHIAAQQIKDEALRLGFDAVGMAQAHEVGPEQQQRYNRWLAQGMNSGMEWAERNATLRFDPRELLPHARTVIALAMNYYPHTKQDPTAAQIAYYAYGRDYHDVMKRRMWQLGAYIEHLAPCQTRACVDSAPVLERYWAQQAGIGYIGVNTMLIIPGRGSYFFLGCLLTTLELPADKPHMGNCGTCGLCPTACPVQAIGPDGVDARRCLSYHTIEHRGPFTTDVAKTIGNHLFGCDDCQICCPHNRRAKPHNTAEFNPKPELLTLTAEQVLSLDQEQYSRIMNHSPIKRAKLAGLQRNAEAIINNKKTQPL